jgi:hypothetical protein
MDNGNKEQQESADQLAQQATCAHCVIDFTANNRCAYCNADGVIPLPILERMRSTIANGCNAVPFSGLGVMTITGRSPENMCAKEKERYDRLHTSLGYLLEATLKMADKLESYKVPIGVSYVEYRRATRNAFTEMTDWIRTKRDRQRLRARLQLFVDQFNDILIGLCEKQPSGPSADIREARDGCNLHMRMIEDLLIEIEVDAM